MNGPNSLTQYRRTGSEDAFADLVHGYANLVYSIAKRRLSNGTLAEEVAQTVFTRLANAVPTIRTDAELVAWLHRTTVHIAIDLWRSETRRRTREQHAAAMEPAAIESDQLWDEIAPHLDEALNELSDAERKAVLLRFFEGKSMREIGNSFGVSEDAAKMRVSRAIDRLRAQLVPRGVTCSVAVLATLIGERSIEAAPGSLAVRLRVVPPPASTVGTATVPYPLFQMSKLKLLGTAALVVALVLLVASRSRQSTTVENTSSEPAEVAVAPDRPSFNSPFARRAALNLRTAAAPVSENIRMLLRVLDEGTGQGLAAAQIRAAYFYAGGRGEGHNLVTDQDGVAAIPVAREGGEPGMNVFVSLAGYVPKAIGFGKTAPAEYVLKVESAVMAAGIVVDEQGLPVPGVLLEARRAEDHEAGKPNTSFQTTKVETDSNGRWLYPYIPKQYEEVRFSLTCDGYAVTQATVLMGKPESLNATLVIKRGFAVTGRVTDAQGTPIPGATVKEFHNYGQRKLSTETDGNGEFLLLGISGPISPKAEIVVAAKGMAPQLRTVELLEPTNTIHFALAKGNLFRGRVVDETGQPLVGVTCRTDSDDRGRRPFEWFTHTDAEGRFEWDSAPGEPVLFWFEIIGYGTIRDLLLTADGSDHEIKLMGKAK